MSQEMRSLRGMKDLMPEEFPLHNYIHQKSKEVSSLYGFREMSTPILEATEVFSRPLGETSDIVSKEMYTFLDVNQESITLRPEFTAGIVRSIISNGRLQQNLPHKFFSFGPAFRRERPQKGRLRQFHQVNCELIGAKEPGADVEVIAMAYHILDALGLAKIVKLELNSLGDQESRSAYRLALVEYLEKYIHDLSDDSKVRLYKNPLRILDSKDTADKKIVADAPKLDSYLNKRSREFFDDVLLGLQELGLAFELNHKLVRGMDYYTDTVFEFTTDKLGSQGTVLGGGRYDGLIELMGGSKTPAIGFAAGVERLAELIASENELVFPETLFAVIPIGVKAEVIARSLISALRYRNFAIDMLYGGDVGKRMKRANSMGALAAIIFGEDELDKNQCKIKDFKSGSEELVDFDKIDIYLNKYS